MLYQIFTYPHLFHFVYYSVINVMCTHMSVCTSMMLLCFMSCEYVCMLYTQHVCSSMHHAHMCLYMDVCMSVRVLFCRVKQSDLPVVPGGNNITAG